MTGIYIHIPFCKQACHYCNFHFSTQLKSMPGLIKGLAKELQMRRHEVQEEKIETLYFGGGTPSILREEDIRFLIEKVREIYPMTDDLELTLEANPDDISQEKLDEWKSLGVNRLSLGIQSFHAEDLKLMNRAHNAKEAERSLALVQSNFENYSVDLIYGIPGSDIQSLEYNIGKLLSYDPPHISAYALTIEPRTALHSFVQKGLVEILPDAMVSDQFYYLEERFTSAGFENYEISNFGKPGYYSRNNSSYWRGGYYLGIGPGAHSFDGVSRSWNVSNNWKYLNAIDNRRLPLSREELTKKDQYNEFVMTGLRTQWGISLNEVREKFGELFHRYLLEQADEHIREGRIISADGVINLDRRAKFLADGIASDLFMINFK